MSMILRIVRGRVADADLEPLRAATTGACDATARATPGLRRYHAATRPIADGGHELVILTCWESIDDALRAYGGDLDAVRTLEDLSPHACLEAVAYFELDEVHDRPVDVPPAFLRLSAGQVARGADADIQRELRSRMFDLGPLVTEGYVARRIIGDAVEVAFISTWEREDPAHPLDAPFWPDVSALYDVFEVGVYRPIASGPTRP
jgi:hypothetical protein